MKILSTKYSSSLNIKEILEFIRAIFMFVFRTWLYSNAEFNYCSYQRMHLILVNSLPSDMLVNPFITTH